MELSDFKNFKTLIYYQDQLIYTDRRMWIRKTLIYVVVLFAVKHDKQGSVFYRDTFWSEGNINKLNIVRCFRKKYFYLKSFICSVKKDEVLTKPNKHLNEITTLVMKPVPWLFVMY